jgi:AcrR family transcriptional regulator
MTTPLRTLRDYAERRPENRPKFSPGELDRQDRILATARSLMARFGRAGLTLHGLAGAMRLAPATIRRHFADLDTILYEILNRHLMDISRAIGDIPLTHPNRQAAQRAAYIEATRNGLSAPIENHTLFLRDRHFLPPDLAEPLEQMRTIIGQNLGGEHEETILALLDNPFVQLPQIETMFAALLQHHAALPNADRAETPCSASPANPIRSDKSQNPQAPPRKLHIIPPGPTHVTGPPRNPAKNSGYPQPPKMPFTLDDLHTHLQNRDQPEPRRCRQPEP